MNWDKVNITNDSGDIVQAQAPIIVSASRSTDIPAFYSDWLVKRIKVGYVKWLNPFNGTPIYVSFEKARLFVFWSKNPKPMLNHLDFLDEIGLNYYFQFTLNNYDTEKIELGVPNINNRIETFIKLSERIGENKIIWRFDPLILTDKIGVEELLRKVEDVGNQIKNYTNKMVFSFADINTYKKVKSNLAASSILVKEFDDVSMNEFANGLKKLNESWKFEIGTCAERIPLEKYDIIHNKCIDDDLIIKLFPNDNKLMNFLGVNYQEPDIFNNEPKILKSRDNKDKGQRQYCGCIFSKDIGEYNTCPHLCEYCYANSSKEIALNNWKMHKINSYSETIKGY